MIKFVVEVAHNKNLRCLYSYFLFSFLKKKQFQIFFIIIWQVYGKLDLASASWSVEITEHKEVVIFKIALPSEKLQTNKVMTQNERSVVWLWLYEARVPTSNMKGGCRYN